MSTEGQGHRHDRPPMQPLRELDELRRRFEDDIARPFLRNLWDRIPEGVKRWAPPVDVFGKGDDLVVKVELPGMKYENIDVSVSDNTLVIKGMKEPESGVKDEDYYRWEIAHGSFYRSVALPYGIDTKNIEAVYEAGILQVTLKRALEAKPQKVEVKIK